MQISCLMAGISSRMKPLTEKNHKASLKMNGASLIEYQWIAMHKAEVKKVNYVLGHGKDTLLHSIEQFSDQVATQWVENPFYGTKNLDYSAYLALKDVIGPTIYFEGDLLVPPSALKSVWESESDICLCLDSVAHNLTADTLVLAEKGKISNLHFVEHGNVSEELRETSVGEFICFIKLSEKARAFIVSELEKQSFIGEMQLYKIFELAFTQFDVAYVDVQGKPWAEIDNIEDFKRAEAIAPKVIDV